MAFFYKHKQQRHMIGVHTLFFFVFFRASASKVASKVLHLVHNPIGKSDSPGNGVTLPAEEV